MTTAKELVDKINAANILTPNRIDDVSGADQARVVTTLDLDQHRWYTVATVVFRVGDEFFGVRGPVSIKSEEMDYSDVGMVCEAFEMETIPAMTYRRKSEQQPGQERDDDADQNC